MRALALFLTLLAAPAGAHPGHIAEVAGHGHWIAAGAIGLAVLIGLLGTRKGRKEETAPEDEAEEEPEAEESAA